MSTRAPFLAPYTCTAIVWATLAGWLLWIDRVTVQVMAGTGVVIAGNRVILRQA